MDHDSDLPDQPDSDPASRALAEGEMLFDVRRYEAAVAAFTRAAGLMPGSAEPLARLAVAHWGAGELTAAINAAQSAVQAEPRDEWAYRMLSFVLREAGRTPEAVAAAERAVLFGPEVAHAHTMLSDARLAAGDAPGARLAADAAVALAPDEAGAWHSLGLALLALDAARDAEDALSRALALAPDDAQVLNSLGVVLRRKGRDDEAAVLYERALATDPQADVAADNLQALLRSKLDGGAIYFVVGLLAGTLALLSESTGPLPLVALACVIVALLAWHFRRRKHEVRALSEIARAALERNR